ncbi:transposase [Micromonospora alfalfae]|uniref:transposase n=1 Tax=Micromonospora alfalfae TaxID=2911212 RepID=UPI0035579112
MARQSKYPEEFRRQAAALVLDSGRTIRDVGRELGVNHETLRNWVDRLRQERDGDRPSDLAADERAGCGVRLPSWSWRNWDWAGRHRTGRDARDARRTSTHRAPNCPQGMEQARGLTAILAGQAPCDLVRPKGLEPLTF